MTSRPDPAAGDPGVSGGAALRPAAFADADIADESLFLATEVSRWSPALGDADRRAWLLLVIASLENQRRGSTRLPLDDTGPDAALSSLLQSLGLDAPDGAAVSALASRLSSVSALAPLVGAPGDYRPFIVDGRYLYLQRVLALETRLATTLRRRLDRRADAPPSSAAVERAMAAAAHPLTAEQRAAIAAMLVQPLTVITGGPGTGKTSIILAALRAMAALGVPVEAIALAAATGKAANRIAASLNAAPAPHHGDSPPAPPIAPQTVHRLLGYRPRARGLRAPGGEFRHHEGNPLPHQFVIVDESSMIDLELMDHLVRAVRDDAHLVLLGDANQLPSVAAGAVFRDLAPVALTLTQSHRMNPALPEGRAILTAAAAVLAGQPRDLQLPLRSRQDELTFSGVELLTLGTAPKASPARTLAAFHAFLDRWYRERVSSLPNHDALASRTFTFRDGKPSDDDVGDLTALYLAQQSHRLLCVTRGSARRTGADAVNAVMHRRALAEQPASAAANDFALGEPVIMLRNDYARGLFNGDQGVCLRVTTSPSDGAPFDAVVFLRQEQFVAFPLAALRADLGLAYAMTVHRAQGSEVEAVALILPDDDLPLLSRELLYTAITRARRSVVIVGEHRILEQGIDRRVVRSSGLAERLALLG